MVIVSVEMLLVAVTTPSRYVLDLDGLSPQDLHHYDDDRLASHRGYSPGREPLLIPGPPLTPHTHLLEAEPHKVDPREEHGPAGYGVDAVRAGGA